MTHGLILFAHGARDPAWAAPFEAVAALVRQRCPGRHVRLAFLEFMPPTLSEAGALLAEVGCGRVDVVPMFLGTGGHVRRDLPLLLESLRAAHPTVQFTLHTAIGEVESVQLAMADSVAATVAATEAQGGNG